MLPTMFCWSRFGTEAGELIEQIIERKELERVRNGGVFLWGIGNAIGPSMRELVRLVERPEVLFSPLIGAARTEDVSPHSTVTWSAARGLDGAPVALPASSCVVSRETSRRRHYALVCACDTPLRLDEDGPRVSMACLVNLLTANPVGASQVTAVVRYQPSARDDSRDYPVSMRARIVPPYFLTLEAPQTAKRGDQLRLPMS